MRAPWNTNRSVVNTNRSAAPRVTILAVRRGAESRIDVLVRIVEPRESRIDVLVRIVEPRESRIDVPVRVVSLPRLLAAVSSPSPRRSSRGFTYSSSAAYSSSSSASDRAGEYPFDPERSIAEARTTRDAIRA